MCAIAAWMNGLEVCSIEADVLDWFFLSESLRTIFMPGTTAKACMIQEDLDSDDCVALWNLLLAVAESRRRQTNRLQIIGLILFIVTQL